MVIVRRETSRDFAAIRGVNEAAFGGPAEAALVDRLRATATPFISLVAEHDQRVAGHVCFSPVTVEGAPESAAMGLAPLAVAPELQNHGIGSQLVRAGLDECRRHGCRLVVVVGHPAYYPRFGFAPAHTFGLTCEYDVPADHFMALALAPHTIAATGVVRYHAAFAEL